MMRREEENLFFKIREDRKILSWEFSPLPKGEKHATLPLLYEWKD